MRRIAKSVSGHHNPLGTLEVLLQRNRAGHTDHSNWFISQGPVVVVILRTDVE